MLLYVRVHLVMFFIMDLLLLSYLYNNIISGSEIKILSDFIEKTIRIYQITKYNVSLWEKLQSKNYEPKHIMIQSI